MTTVNTNVTVNPKDPEIPEEFYEALREAREGKLIDMEIALSEPPPEEDGE